MKAFWGFSFVLKYLIKPIMDNYIQKIFKLFHFKGLSSNHLFSVVCSRISENWPYLWILHIHNRNLSYRKGLLLAYEWIKQRWLYLIMKIASNQEKLSDRNPWQKVDRNRTRRHAHLSLSDHHFIGFFCWNCFPYWSRCLRSLQACNSSPSNRAFRRLYS